MFVIRPMLDLRSSPYGLIGGALAYPSPAGALFFEAGRRPAPLLHDQPAALLGSEVELLHGCGFRRLTGRRLYIA